MATETKPERIRDLESWAAANQYEIVVDAKAGNPPLWLVTLVALYDKRKFAGSASGHTASVVLYRRALDQAVGKARAWHTRDAQ